MRLDNDRPVESGQPPIPDFFSVLTYGLLCSFGIMTFLLSPLVMVYSHSRLVEPWAKLAAVIGALVAVCLWEWDPVSVIVAFVFGLVCADTVTRGVPKAWGFVRVMASGAAVAVGVVVVLSSYENLGPWQYWVQHVGHAFDVIAEQLKNSPNNATLDLSQLKHMVIYQGPFQFLTVLLLIFWLAVGTAAHFGWTPATSPWGGKGLKAIPLHKWPSFVFLGLFMVVTFKTGPLMGTQIGPQIGGLLSIGLGWMFIQGTVVLARWLNQRKMTQQQKTLAYCLGIFPGFHALIGLGVIGPWFSLGKKSSKENK